MSDAIQQAAIAEVDKHRRLLSSGRKTQRPRHKCVRVTLRGRANPHVRLRIRGGEFDGLAREITDADERGLARELICDTVVPTDYGECALHLRGRPTRTKIQDLHPYWFETGIPIAIDLKETRP